MDAALFVPCYVDQFYPRVGLAAAAVLERHGGRAAELHGKVFELCQFLHDVVQARPRGRFAACFGLHQGCHGLRELRPSAATASRCGACTSPSSWPRRRRGRERARGARLAVPHRPAAQRLARPGRLVGPAEARGCEV